MDNIWDALQNIAEDNDGYIRTRDVEAAGISRPMIKKYKDLGKLEQVRKGLYVITDGICDDFALLQAQSEKAIYSYETALYLWGMSDRVPHVLDITFPQGTNASRLKRDNSNLQFHYVQKDKYAIGITKVKTPLGAEVNLYDKERCICDLVRDKDQIDMQLFTQAIKSYFKNNPNYRRLLKYAEVFGVVKNIRMYMEVL